MSPCRRSAAWLSVLLLLVAPVSSLLLQSADAAVTSSQSCTSAVPWTVKATWGDRYTDPTGVSRVAVNVAWTAKSGSRLTQWEVRSYNGDGSIAGTVRGQDSYAYANGTGWRQVDAVDPTGTAPSVRVRVGVALDGRADCLLMFTAPVTTSPSPSPTPTTKPTPTSTPSPTVTPTPTAKPTPTTTPTPTPTTKPSPTSNPTPTPTPTPTVVPTPTTTPTPTPTTSPSPTAAPSPTQGPILFQDDFTGAAGQTFDHTKWQDWSACTYNPSAAFGDIKCGDDETLDGQGHLQIPATPDSGSAISTLTKFGFEYGEMSAWIENPAADGYWPAFWTVNTASGADTSTPIGEIDAMEGYTTWDTLFHRGVHNWNGALGWDSPDTVCGNTDLTTGFHKYTVRVEPGKISFFFDDQPCGAALTKEQGNGKPYAFGPDRVTPNFMILDLAVGGAGGQQNPATQPATMLVDRVEVRGL